MDKTGIAFVTPEMAIHQSIPTYTGGLGYVSASAARSARKLELPFIGITILPQQGQYEQYVDSSGMKVRFTNWDYESVLEATSINQMIYICGSPVKYKAYVLPEDTFGNAPIYFITTNVEGNDNLSRSITLQLYGGTLASEANSKRKIALSYVLAKGAIEIMKSLGFEDIVYHVNESHGVFVCIELMHQYINEGISFDDALAFTRGQILFTTHTIVPAGNPMYNIDEINEITGYRHDILFACGGDSFNMFNMAKAGFFTSGHSNTVSKKHEEVVRHLWRGLIDDERLTSVTNGVDKFYWQCPEFERAKQTQNLYLAKLKYKRAMLQKVRHLTERRWSENVPTIVWARRIEEYKRPWLILSDIDWLKERLNTNAFQLIFAGKPHPDNQPMIDFWNYIYLLSNTIPNLIILPGYDLEMSKLLKAGTDFWLNTPRIGYEACGTSGMSAAMNGALNISTPDGWMCEANPNNCFLFGTSTSDISQDAIDARDLRDLIDNTILPLYYRKEERYQMALRAMKEAVIYWDSSRMMKEYTNLYYPE
ncbi:MAG: glycogen/starch/alpha-glucan phosphorylase [bacterium]|nr:glycogen/starch/alpha-glucan phosphorylase [bacterium]